MISAIRLRRLLAEDVPVIHAYDQEVFAARLRYNERELAPALEAFRAARSTSVQLLERMTARDWARQAWHTEGGPYGPERWLEIYAVHAHNHAPDRALAAATASGATGESPPPGGERGRQKTSGPGATDSGASAHRMMTECLLCHSQARRAEESHGAGE
jgi:hypothetical protein